MTRTSRALAAAPLQEHLLIPGLDPHAPYFSRLSARSALYSELALLLAGRSQLLPLNVYRVVARRGGSNTPVVTYIQAKRFTSREVGKPMIKEFVATVAADRVDQGVLIATSHFSKPGELWLVSKGSKLADVTLVNGRDLVEQVRTAAVGQPGVFLTPLAGTKPSPVDERTRAAGRRSS